MRISDDFPINAIPKSDDEKYIIEEAKFWFKENNLI